jgi:hypothetical protein
MFPHTDKSTHGRIQHLCLWPASRQKGLGVHVSKEWAHATTRRSQPASSQLTNHVTQTSRHSQITSLKHHVTHKPRHSRISVGQHASATQHMNAHRRISLVFVLGQPHTRAHTHTSTANLHSLPPRMSSAARARFRPAQKAFRVSRHKRHSGCHDTKGIPGVTTQKAFRVSRHSIPGPAHAICTNHGFMSPWHFVCNTHKGAYDAYATTTYALSISIKSLAQLRCASRAHSRPSTGICMHVVMKGGRAGGVLTYSRA